MLLIPQWLFCLATALIGHKAQGSAWGVEQGGMADDLPVFHDAGDVDKALGYAIIILPTIGDRERLLSFCDRGFDQFDGRWPIGKGCEVKVHAPASKQGHLKLGITTDLET